MTPISDIEPEIEALYAGLKQPHPVLVVLSGPSGVGKDATLQAMQAA